MARKPGVRITKAPPVPVSERARGIIATQLTRTNRLGLTQDSALALADEILDFLKENHIVPRTESD